MIGYQLTLSALSDIPDGMESASLERLESDYPLPSAFAAYLPYLGKKKQKNN
jgi:hypothetical protein